MAQECVMMFLSRTASLPEKAAKDAKAPRPASPAKTAALEASGGEKSLVGGLEP